MNNLRIQQKIQARILVATLLVVAAVSGAFAQGAWSVRNPLPPIKSLQALNWTGTQLIAVGDSGTVVTSATGSTWTQRTSGTGSALYSVTTNAAGTLTLAVGAAGTILSSTDGITWTPKPSGTDKALLSVTPAGSQYAAVGALGTIVVSPDGNTWSTSPSGVTTDLNGVAWNGSFFVAVGAGGVILRSSNGSSWTAMTSNTTQTLYTVGWVGGKFIAAGNAGTIRTSTDGQTWASPVSNVTTYLSGIGAQGANIVIVGNGGTVVTSPDGNTWTSRTAGSATTNPLRGVAYTGSRWVAVGTSGTIRVSNDAITWADPSVTTSDLNAVTSNSAQMIAVGVAGVILGSADGTSWASQPSGITTNLFGVTWSGTGGKFVAVGAGGVIRTSSNNGSTWGAATSGTANPLNGVTWTGTKLVAVGNAGTIRTSTADAVTWGGPASQGTFTLYSVTSSGPNLMVAVGSAGTILSSTDAITWNPRLSNVTTTLYSVTYGAGQFVVVGASGVIKTSEDGTTWTTRTSGTTSPLYSVIWTGSLFVAASTAGTVLISTDGITWTSQSTATTYAFYALGLRADSTLLVAVGSGGALLTSPKISAPAAPVLGSPAAGATDVSSLVNLSWAAVSGATSYTVQVSTDAGFASTLVNEVLTSTGKSIGPLANSTTYHWRVSAKNAVLSGSFSASRSFTTGVAPTEVPARVALDTPVQFTSAVPLTTKLKWKMAARAQLYHLQISTEATNFTASKIVFQDSMLTDTVRTVGPLLGNTSYYWRVQARNQVGYGLVSPVWNFTTVATPPAVPVLTSPTIYLTGVSQTPTLTWEATTGATSYRVQLSTNGSTFSPLLANDSISATSLTVGPLTVNTDYFWRVRAINATGSSAFSDAFKFTTTPTSIRLPGRLQLMGTSLGQQGAVRFTLASRQQVAMRLFDMQGRLMASLLNEQRDAGEHFIVIPQGLQGSLYVLDFRAGETHERIKIFP